MAGKPRRLNQHRARRGSCEGRVKRKVALGGRSKVHSEEFDLRRTLRSAIAVCREMQHGLERMGTRLKRMKRITRHVEIDLARL